MSVSSTTEAASNSRVLTQGPRLARGVHGEMPIDAHRCPPSGVGIYGHLRTRRAVSTPLPPRCMHSARPDRRPRAPTGPSRAGRSRMSGASGSRGSAVGRTPGAGRDPCRFPRVARRGHRRGRWRSARSVRIPVPLSSSGDRGMILRPCTVWARSSGGGCRADRQLAKDQGAIGHGTDHARRGAIRHRGERGRISRARDRGYPVFPGFAAAGLATRIGRSW